MTALWLIPALIVLALVWFLRSRDRREGWQWSWSKGTRKPVVNGDTVTASLQGECSMLLNYSPPKKGGVLSLEYRVTGGPFIYAYDPDLTEEENKRRRDMPVLLELILVRRGVSDWTAGTPENPTKQADYRQYHVVGPMQAGEWQVHDVPLSQPFWHNVWGRARGLSTTLGGLDAVGLRWRHGMETSDPNAQIEFRLRRI